jgi:putative peptidoglycan lipid II flippase
VHGRPFTTLGGSLPSITATYAGAVVLDRIAAFLVVGMLAWFYGAGTQTDAYYIAYWLPVMLFTIVGEVAFAFIVPEISALVFAGHRAQAIDKSLRYVAIGLILGAVTSLVYLALVPPSVALLGHGFSADTRDVANSLALIFGVYVGLMVVTTIAGSVLAAWGLHARNAFVLPVSTVAIAASVATFHALGYGIRSFPLGAAAGQATALIAVLLPGIWRLWTERTHAAVDRYPRAAASNAARTIGALVLPVAIPVFLIGLERGLAGLGGAGSAAILGFARTPLILPGLIAAPLGTALISRLTRATRRERSASIWTALSWSVFYGITVTFILAVGAETFLRILYAHGSFTSADLSRTRIALLLMLTGFGGMCVYPVLMRVLQAERKFPVLIASALSALSYVAIAPALALMHGTAGLALAFGIATSIPGVVSAWVLAKEDRPPANLVRGWLLQAAVMATFALLHYALVDPRLDVGSAKMLSVLALETAIYLAVLWLLRVPETRQTSQWVVKSLGERKA